MQKPSTLSPLRNPWRSVLLSLIVAASLALMLSRRPAPPVFAASTVGLLGSPPGQGPLLAASALLGRTPPPFGEGPTHHKVADRRAFFGIPSFCGGVTNLPFLVVG